MITESVCSVQLRQWAAIVVDITFTSRKEEVVGKKSLLERKCVEKRPPFSVLLVFAVIYLVYTSSTQNESLNTSLETHTSIGKKKELL